jgi:hypothetical protein
MEDANRTVARRMRRANAWHMVQDWSRFLLVLLVAFASADLNAQTKVFSPIYIEPGPALAARFGVDTTTIGAVQTVFDTTFESAIRVYAALFLAERGVSSIAPRVKQLFHDEWHRESGGNWADDYVLALYFLRDPETTEFLHAFIDSVLVRRHSGQFRRAFRYVEPAIQLLFNLGDYSRFDLLSSYFEDELDTPQSGSLGTLAAFADVPLYRDAVYARLQDFLDHPDTDYRWHAVFHLHQNFPDRPELRSILRWVAQNDTSFKVKHEATDALTFLYRDPFVLQVLEEVCLSTTDTSAFEHSIWDIRLSESILAYPTLVRIRESLPAGAFRDLATHQAEFYAPPDPDKTVTPLVMLDSLISYKHQCHALGWILNEGILTSLDQKLNAARKAIVNDRPSAKQILQAFVNEVEALNNQGNQISREAYVFLRYHALYIIERL